MVAIFAFYRLNGSPREMGEKVAKALKLENREFHLQNI